MDIIRGIHNFPFHYAPCVAAIGNFDGVHKGHQTLFEELRKLANIYQLPAIAITFEPHPAEFFSSDNPPARLTRMKEKLFLLKQCPLDATLIISFNKKFAALSPEEFIQQILINKLNIKSLLIGEDFRFGKNRQGDKHSLQKASEQFGFELKVMPTLKNQLERISSTRLRESLTQGDLTKAQQLLGHPYSMMGAVVHGTKRGRLLGFPTANIHLKRKQTPLLGVYAVEMLGINTIPLKGVANLGKRPTVAGTRILLEVHLFDFNQDIYGKLVQINFLKKLRNEKRFDSLDDLKHQIMLDVEAAKSFFVQRA
ncbi:MAG: Bifunctional riboflavin kinase/FMN adenylyltransferase [Legionellaceae bacterium]